MQEPLLATEAGDSRLLTKDVAADIRLGFVRKVYGILSVQLLVTVIVALPIAQQDLLWLRQHVWLSWLSMAVYLAMACTMGMARNMMRTFPVNYIMLFVFTVAMSIMVGFISAMYTWKSLMLAAALTAFIFGGLTAYACTTKSDFTGFGPYLFLITLVLCAFGMVMGLLSFFGIVFQPLMLVYDAVGVLLFSAYVVYDTQLILGEYGGHKEQFDIDDYCLGALQLYMDIINLFILIMELLGDRRGS